MSQEYLPDSVLEENTLTFPPIASFWRRLAAWLIDVLLLGIVGQIIGWVFSSFWFSIGPYGRLFGLLLILSYFGVMNSSIAKGQTLGKRVLAIAVRNRRNTPISFGRALLRTAILVVPELFNQWTIPPTRITAVAWLVGILIFGLGAAQVYTMLFNARARQGLHDLVCGTYVVYLKGKPIAEFPRTARVHWYVSAALVVGVSILFPILNFYLANGIFKASLANITPAYDALIQDPRYFNVSISDMQTSSSQGGTARVLELQVWVKGRPSEEEAGALFDDLARRVLANTDRIDQYDGMRITISSNFDLLVASGHVSSSNGKTLAAWKEHLGALAP